MKASRAGGIFTGRRHLSHSVGCSGARKLGARRLHAHHGLAGRLAAFLFPALSATADCAGTTARKPPTGISLKTTCHGRDTCSIQYSRPPPGLSPSFYLPCLSSPLAWSSCHPFLCPFSRQPYLCQPWECRSSWALRWVRVASGFPVILQFSPDQLLRFTAPSALILPPLPCLRGRSNPNQIGAVTGH